MKLRKSTEAGAYIVELVKKRYQAFAINTTKETLFKRDHILTRLLQALQMPFYIFLPYAYELGVTITLDDFVKYAKGITAFALM